MAREIQLRGGRKTRDRRLDRIPAWDRRNENYRVRRLSLSTELQARSWSLPRDEYLDQGYEGACVGAGITHELKATPIGTGKLDMTWAREQIYWPAQREDWWEGGSYEGASPFYEGTSVLHGLKEAQRLGWCENFWWAATMEEALQALVHVGPLVIGVDMSEGMAEPRPSGLVRDEGEWLGGHCMAVLRYIPRPRLRGESGLPPLLGLAQSWGADHGDRGMIYWPVAELEAQLMSGVAEIAAITGRRRPRR